jgi:hypothetical protein
MGLSFCLHFLLPIELVLLQSYYFPQLCDVFRYISAYGTDDDWIRMGLRKDGVGTFRCIFLVCERNNKEELRTYEGWFVGT